MMEFSSIYPPSSSIQLAGEPTVTTGQAQYCEMCQKMLASLFSKKYQEKGWWSDSATAVYKLDVATIVAKNNCSCCEMIYRRCKRWDGFSRKMLANSSENSLSDKSDVKVSHHNGFLRIRSEDNKHEAHLDVAVAWTGSYDHLVATSTDSPESWNLAKRWIQDCQAGHDCVNTSYNYKLPTRLVKIGKRLDGYHSRLIETTSLDDKIAYCTLSHCWGKANVLKLLSSNYAEFSENIPFHSLSATFQDAIYAASILGYEYIWIDSLCIIQLDVKDWAREAGTMSDVYAGSDLNLAASQGENGGRGGFFNTRDPKAIIPCLSRWLETPTAGFLIYDEELWQDMLSGPLGSRAWIFQERFLAPRTLHFGPEQLFWECKAGAACESHPWDPIARKKHHYYMGGLSTLRGKEFVEMWCSALQQYSNTLLTFASDKLVALSGMAKYLAESGSGKEYIGAGMWKKDLELQLLWEVNNSEDSISGVRLSTYRAPSWSWACLEEVSIRQYLLLQASQLGKDDSERSWDCREQNIHVVDTKITPKIPGNIYGEITFASLTIQCTSLKMLPTLKTTRRMGYLESCDGAERIQIILDIMSEGEIVLKNVYLLRILTIDAPFNYTSPHLKRRGNTGLMLQRSALDAIKFQRIGMFWIDHSEISGHLGFWKHNVIESELCTFERLNPAITEKHIPADLHIDTKGINIGLQRPQCACSQYPTPSQNTETESLIPHNVEEDEEAEAEAKSERLRQFMLMWQAQNHEEEAIQSSPGEDGNFAQEEEEAEIDGSILLEEEDRELALMKKRENFNIKDYRSFIWENLPDANMDESAPPSTDGSKEENRKKIITTLV